MHMTHDYVIVGGGTAGAILAARLSEDPEISVAVLEWGPSDEGEPRALMLQRYPEMLGSEFDLSYACDEPPGGNPDHRLARGRILGGTSSINNMGALPPIPSDLAAWAAQGVTGWEYDEFARYRERVAAPVTRPGSEGRNECLDTAIAAASTALGVPVVDAWPTEQIRGGVGYLDLGYDPHSGRRSSSSVSYLHGVHGTRANLHLVLESRAVGLELDGTRVVGVRAIRSDGSELQLSARHEVVLSCGAVDTPRLLMLSGIGPAAQLESVGIPSRLDLPGVGENLMDHVEGLVVFALNRSTAGGWPMELDAVAFVAPVDDGAEAPQVMAHMFRFAPDESYGGARGIGYAPPEHPLSITPNVTLPRSRGHVRLAASDPNTAPVIDFGYFSDPDGHDAGMMLAGIRMARKVGATAPLASWIDSEVFPGPDLQTDAELLELARATHGSVCHAAGTCKMGSPSDPMAVLDSRLRVRHLDGIRVVDASAFPVLTTFNPMVTVMTLAERAASMIQDDRLAFSRVPVPGGAQ